MSDHEGAHDVTFNQVENSFFFIDSYGTRSPQKSVIEHKAAVNAAGASSELDSSEDEVVFSGRQTSRNDTGTNTRSRSPVAPSRVAVTVLEDDIQFPIQSNAQREVSGLDTSGIGGAKDLQSQNSYIGFSTNKKNAKKRKGKKKKSFSWEEENSIFADYIENVNQNEMWSDWLSGDELSEDTPNLSKKDKTKFRSLSALDSIGENSMQQDIEDFDDVVSSDEDEDEDDDDDEDFKDEDADDSLDSIISQIRRGASFGMLKERQIMSNDMSNEILEGENYVDFDILDMQQDGPLVGKKKNKKGRRRIDFDLSDSDLELQMEKTWEKDRKTKREKKREREQLRAEGLLGKKQKKLEQRSKDKSGFGIEKLKVDLKNFLQSQSESLDLPPMKKHHRRVVHELANALGLKSQSRGKGNSRFPVLYKTNRTPNFNGKHSVKLDKILSQPRFNQQRHARMTPSEREPAPKNNRRRPNMAAGYLDGEVVGGSAPEIGADNKGRAMLEKMGWSSGTALGALNNKGILQPVAHIVKNSRAGLG